MKNKVTLLDVRPLYKKDKFEHYLMAMDDFRRQKIDRLRSPAAKALSLGAGILLEEAAQKHYQNKARPQLVVGDCGKLKFLDEENFFFNLSHSGTLAVCGTGPRPLGLDVQVVGKAKDELARRFFHQKEVAFLQSLPENKKDLAFAQIWAAKESYIKYQGSGLGFPLNAFYIEFMIESEEWRVKNCSQPGVNFKNYPLADDYALWFCAEHDQFSEAVWLEI